MVATLKDDATERVGKYDMQVRLSWLAVQVEISRLILCETSS